LTYIYFGVFTVWG